MGEDDGENDSGQLEVNDEPIQREGIPQDLNSEGSLEEKEKNFSELIEGTEANEDTKEAGAIETDHSEQPLSQIYPLEQPQLGRRKKIKNYLRKCLPRRW